VPRLLIVEDDPITLSHLEKIFRNDKYDVLTATDGNEGLRLAREERPDLIVLDWELPTRSGYEICIALRQDQTRSKILMLTGVRTEADDEVKALQTAADEYVMKSSSDLVLLERARRLLRGARLPDTVQFDDITVDFRAMEVNRAGKRIPMRRKEFEVLRQLVARAGEVVSRDDLRRRVWDSPRAGSNRSIDNVMATLRRKLERDPKKPVWLITISGIGYKFEKTADVIIT
jgi:DNA-binding response OmpR family regulator